MRGIIIGGGIGGLTTAIALKQQGIDVTVTEAVPELLVVGAGIVMASNAMQVMQRLGMDEKIAANGHKLMHGEVADQHWRPIQKVDIDSAIQKFGIGSYAIHRGALQQVLFQELPEGWIKLNHKVVSVNQQGNKVKVVFENGQTDEADFVIGADGIKSVVRQVLFGKTTFRYSGQTCWRGAVTMPVPEKLKNSTYELWGSKAGLRFGLVAVRQNMIYFFATICAPEGGKDDPATLKNDLRKNFGEFGALPLQLIEAAESQKIIRTDIFDFAPIPTWCKGRIALMGDAAHATTPNLGQGGCQAVEDAFVVAKMLKEIGEPEAAFKAFQEVRYKKARYVVDTSWQFGKLTNLSAPWQIKLRNGMLRAMPASVGIRTIEKLCTLNY